MKKVLVTFLLFIALSVSMFANGLSLNSIGPRALGMGGSFVGLANDYTSIYWNPAGISQIKGNYIGIFSTDVIPVATYKNPLAKVDATTKTNHYISPNAMGYFSFAPATNLTVALGVYVPAGLGAEWNGSELKNLVAQKEVEWMSKIGVVNISPAVSYKFSDNLSLGLAVNIFYGMFDLKRPAPSPLGVFQYSESSTGLGYGITFGGLFKVNEMISLGASVRTKTKVTMSGSATNGLMPKLGGGESSDFDRDVAWPLWIAGGVAVRPMDNWVITFDAQYSQWSKSEDEFVTKFKDAVWVKATEPTGQNKFILHWNDATQLRVGTEYKLADNIAVRAGYYYDPAPAPDETYNLLFPSITYNAFTAGVSYTVSKLTFDLGFEYLKGKDREISQKVNPSAFGTQGMNITAVSLGAGYAF
ncbi:MAG: OmpP1/FadL family transporter [Bacillota bacterium]